MAERFNAPVLKTGDPQGSVGSNPTPSVLGYRFAVHRSQFAVYRSQSSDAMNPSIFIKIIHALWLIPRPPSRHQLGVGFSQSNTSYLCAFASLADVAKGADGVTCPP
jgi:hypothetical protein